MLAKIIDWSTQNRLLVCVVALVLGVSGLWSMRTISLDAIPDLSDVQVIVHTDWHGRDPQTIEDQITYPISSALLNVAQVRDVRGRSMFGTSFVYAIFADGTDPYWARSRVLENLSQVQRNLPQGVTPSLGPDASGVGWVYLYTLEDTRGVLDLGQLRELQDTYVRYQLASVPGVAEVATFGGGVRQYQVTVDPRALSAYGLPLSRVIQAVRRSNNDVGGRVVEMAEAEYMVRAGGSIGSIQDLESVVVGMGPEATPVQLREIATVAMGPNIKRGIAEKNGRGEVVAGIVTMRYGENALNVINAVKERIAEISAGLPDGVVIRKAYDRSGLIERSLDTLSRQLIEEVLIVAGVCVLFLWHARSALVSAFILPLGILVSFILMRFLGINANIMSLGGIAIAIGTMVDASVVMVENLHKHRESGTAGDHWDVVRKASREVGPALFFSLLIITVSFLPVFALEDVEGRLFKPLALTKTSAMASAAVLTLVLMPVLMGMFVRGKLHGEAHNPLSRVMIGVYRPVLNFALRHRVLSIVAAFAVLGATYVPLSMLGSEFRPPLREGDALAMPTTLPGISSTEARRTLQIQDRLLTEFPEVEVVLGKVGRADTALDPAPLAMVETHITMHPEESWPARIIELPWLKRQAGHMVAEARRRDLIAEEPAADAKTAEQTALMAHASLTRWFREGMLRGEPRAVLREELAPEVSRQLAVHLVEYLESQVALSGDADAAQQRLVDEVQLVASGDAIPLRRTDFEELTKTEMNAHVQIPGMPNVWLMPIETRIGMLATGMKTPVGVKVYGRDLAELDRVVTGLEDVLKDAPGTLKVTPDRPLGGRYLDIDIDREECARYGVTVGAVQDVIETAIGGKTITKAVSGRARIPVTVRYPRELRDDPVRLGRTLVATPMGEHVPLIRLAKISLREGPPVIKSENGLLLTSVPIIIQPGLDVGTYVERAKPLVDRAVASGALAIPTGTSIVWSGDYQMMERVEERLTSIIPFTLVIILLLMYLTIRSFTETLIAMLTLPFALVGGVWLLFALDYDLSVAVYVGFIALAGLAAETALLMHVYLDIAYKKRAADGVHLSGAALNEAVIEGAVLRVRPKMMTVVTTILALAPIMWATGTGSGPMKRMAAPMIGGLISSMLFTLILIPVYYAMFREFLAKRGVGRGEAAA